jgi:hypothetical protein
LKFGSVRTEQAANFVVDGFLHPGDEVTPMASVLLPDDLDETEFGYFYSIPPTQRESTNFDCFVGDRAAFGSRRYRSVGTRCFTHNSEVNLKVICSISAIHVYTNGRFVSRAADRNRAGLKRMPIA